jgi:hypothetical protein
MPGLGDPKHLGARFGLTVVLGRLSALDGRPCWHMVTGGPRANDKRGVIDSLNAMRDA